MDLSEFLSAHKASTGSSLHNTISQNSQKDKFLILQRNGQHARCHLKESLYVAQV
jgi:hypothetical protein